MCINATAFTGAHSQGHVSLSKFLWLPVMLKVTNDTADAREGLLWNMNSFADEQTGLISSNLFGGRCISVAFFPIIQQAFSNVLEELKALKSSTTIPSRFRNRSIPRNESIQHHAIQDSQIHLLVPLLEVSFV
jgi:hypothetical protein